MLTTYRVILAAYIALAAAIVVWNVSATSRTVYDRRTPAVLRALTAFGALLFVPAMLVTVTQASIVYGRAIQPVSWVWPVVAMIFLLQAVVALGRRMVHPLFGLPVLAYDLMIAAVAVARYLNGRGTEPPEAMLVLSAAQASALGVVGGTAALCRATWLLVPLFSPAFPSRSRFKRVVRAGLAIGVTVATALVVIELPTSVEAIRSYRKYERAALQERPAGDFAFGLKIFPELRAAPPGLAIDNDFALADSLDVDAISIVVHPEAARGKALDSLAHTLDAVRDENTTLIVTLGYPRRARVLFTRDSAAYVDARLKDVDRLARALRPNVLLPALEPYGEGMRVLGALPPEFWIGYLRRAAGIAHHVNPNIRVGVAAASYGPRDSALYAWTASRASPVDVVGFSLMPGFGGAISLDTHMRIARRWMEQFDRPKPHWVWAAGGYPVVHGERSQVLALRGVLAWATAQEQVAGVVITEAGDYDAQRGLRAPGGRLRPATGEVARAVRSIRETAAQ